VIAAVIGFCGSAAGMSWLVWGALVGFILLTIYVVFATPMTVYKIGVLRSILFVVLAGIIVSAGQFGTTAVLQIVLKDTAMGAAIHAVATRDPALRNAGLASLRKAAPPLAESLDKADATIAADRSQPVAVRSAALQRMREVLEARRIALDPKDKAAIADYKRDADRYSQLYREVGTQAPKP
jgi:hypothetical protein